MVARRRVQFVYGETADAALCIFRGLALHQTSGVACPQLEGNWCAVADLRQVVQVPCLRLTTRSDPCPLSVSRRADTYVAGAII